MKRGAKFSDDRKYRYVLWRIWDEKKPMVMFIGVNPSSADENKDDPTIRRVVGFAKKWGYGGVYMVNVFPYIATKQRDLIRDDTKYNRYVINKTSEKCKEVVFAWGRNKWVPPIDAILKLMFPKAKCLGKNLDGSPKHPLFLPIKTKLSYYDLD